MGRNIALSCMPRVLKGEIEAVHVQTGLRSYNSEVYCFPLSYLIRSAADKF